MVLPVMVGETELTKMAVPRELLIVLLDTVREEVETEILAPDNDPRSYPAYFITTLFKRLHSDILALKCQLLLTGLEFCDKCSTNQVEINREGITCLI